MKTSMIAQTLLLSTNAVVLDTLPNPPLLLSPVFPPPQHLRTNFGFLSACSQLSSTLASSLFEGRTPFGNFTRNATSLSISMTSTAQSPILFSFNFTGSNLNTSAGGTDQVSIDTVFRIGSISKLFTVYTFLLHGGLELWQQPVTNYVPELRLVYLNSDNSSNLDSARWEEVTLGSLASHMSGIGRDYGSADISLFPFPWAENGLPPLAPDDIVKCAGSITHEMPCTREEYFQGFVHHHPVFLPHSTPIYSNTAFRILSYALEAITGTSFDNLIEECVFRPLQLNNTSTRSPADNLGVIPQGDSSWSYDIGDEGPGGGMYSSSSDLANFGRDILLNTQLPPSITRRWMKPVTHTSGLTLSVGAPWEIWRTKTNITTGHIVDLYTKGGSIGLYNSLLVLIPDYKVVIAILTAGPEGNVINAVAIAEMVVQSLVPVLHQASREEAGQNIVGNYEADAKSNINSSATIGADDVGLVVERWISNGSDLLALVETYAQLTGGGTVRSVRLVPTDLVEDVGAGKRVGYRVLFDVGGNETTATKVFNQNFGMWGQVDDITYGKTGVDDVVVEFNGEGGAVSIEPRVLGVKLLRT